MFKTGVEQILKPTRRVVSMSIKSLSTRANPEISENVDNFLWHWPVSKEMEMFLAGHNIGTRQPVGLYTYNTKKPLHPDQFEESLRHLQRRVQNLRTFTRERDGKVWNCENVDPELDFEYLDGAQSADVIDQIYNIPFSGSQTPTWKVRLMPMADDAHCSLPEVKAAFPHQYQMVILPHHAFIDGITMCYATGKLVNILNDVIEGKYIDDKPYGIYLSNQEIANIDSDIAKNLQKNPENLEAMKNEILACESNPLLMKAFPPPGGQPRTSHISRYVSDRDMASFKSRCKANNVTFNSGMEALVNTAIMQLTTEAGVELDSHAFCVTMSTDLRRYMKRRQEPIFGLHVRPMVHRIQTSSNVRDHFWDYTRVLHQKLSLLVKSGEALQQAVVKEIALPYTPPAEYFASKPTPIRDYCLTNIGDVTPILPGVGEHLQQTDLGFFNSTHYSGIPMSIQVIKFRGVSSYSMTYDTSYLSRETADLLIDRLVSLMKEIGSSS